MNSTTNVTSFPAPHRTVSNMRSRDKVLEILLPKIIGFVWDQGHRRRSASLSMTAMLNEDIEVGGHMLFPGAYGFHVYLPTFGEPWEKVFSVHVADRVMVSHRVV